MAERSPSGEALLAAVLQFAVRCEHELLTGQVALRLHARALEYLASRLRAWEELDALRRSAPTEFLRGALTDPDDFGRLQRLRQTLAHTRRLRVLPTVPHLRDPTRVNLLAFRSLHSLELRGCDLSTSAWLGLANLQATLRSLACEGCLEELRHLLAPAQPLLSLAGTVPFGERRGAQAWQHLASLRCRRNSFAEMDGSLGLAPALACLDLGSNNLTAIRNLHAAARLTELCLGRNAISSLAPLRECPARLQRLDLQGNAVRSLQGLEGLSSLTELDLRCNLLASYQQLSSLAGLRRLGSLWLEGNPLAYAPFYRLDVLAWFDGARLALDGARPGAAEAGAAALRAAGDVPHAWHILALYIDQRQLLWRPSRIAAPRGATVWRAASVEPSSPVGTPAPGALLARGASRRAPARRIVDFPGDALAALRDALQRPPSPCPFEARDEEASSRASSERGLHLSRPPSRLPAVQTVYRPRDGGEEAAALEPPLPVLQPPRQASAALSGGYESDDTSSLATSASSRSFSLPPTPQASPRRRPASAASFRTPAADAASPEEGALPPTAEGAAAAPGG